MMGMRSAGIILATVTLVIAGLDGAAVAQVHQESVSALKGHNSNAPVDVTADRIEVQDRADRAIFAGNVHVTQAELSLETPLLTVAYSGGQAGGPSVQISRSRAIGRCRTRAERLRDSRLRSSQAVLLRCQLGHR